MFLQVSVCPHGGVGVCVTAPGGMRGCSGGHVWLLPGGHAWLLRGCAWDTMRYGDTINERAVRILLECILVLVMCYLE